MNTIAISISLLTIVIQLIVIGMALRDIANELRMIRQTIIAYLSTRDTGH